MDQSVLEHLATRIRTHILKATTHAGSGHPTSSLSAVELLTALFFGGVFRQDTKNPLAVYNDRFVLSKGHAAPLLYAVYEAAGCITAEELYSLRQPDSRLQGHPTPDFPFVDVATGSLGQGLSIGAGMALGLTKMYKGSSIPPPRVYVLLGDSELAEGQNWEAIQLASHYKLSNLVALIDVNRLGQRGETMLGWNTQTYADRFAAFGWNPINVTDGNNIGEVLQAYKSIQNNISPSVIIAKTVKGKGVSFLENQEGWHGKALTSEELQRALSELGRSAEDAHGQIARPDTNYPRSPLFSQREAGELTQPSFNGPVATREAFGAALAVVAQASTAVIALDAETSNSTYAERVKKTVPEQLCEMFIAEQNMVSMALGLSKLGCVPFVSTFAAFLSRAFDQIRMAQYSRPNIKLVGSHAGCSIGQDGASQMALEDIALMRSIRDSVVLYPSDAVSTAKLVAQMARHTGISYLRLTREKTPLLYPPDEQFPIGGLKVMRHSEHDIAVVIAAGITLHEALKAYELLKEKGIYITVVDLYSVKPLDRDKLQSLTQGKKQIMVVEDHYQYGGIGEAVAATLGRPIEHLCVQTEPHSLTPNESLARAHIAAQHIVDALMPT